MNFHFFSQRITLIIFMYLFVNQVFALSDTTKVIAPVLETDTLEAAAAQGQEESLEMIYAQNQNLVDTGESYTSSEIGYYSENQRIKKKKIKKKKAGKRNPLHFYGSKSSQKKLKKHKERKVKKQYFGKERKGWNWNLNLWKPGKLIDLDWFMVGLALALFSGLVVLLYFLTGGGILSFLEMLLFALGFGFALFSYYLLKTESDTGMALYDYFIRFGLFSWIGVMALFAGFAGLFSWGGTFLGYLVIGAIVGGISFIISLMAGRTFWHRW